MYERLSCTNDVMAMRRIAAASPFGAVTLRSLPNFRRDIQARRLNEFGGHFFCPVHTRFPAGDRSANGTLGQRQADLIVMNIGLFDDPPMVPVGQRLIGQTLDQTASGLIRASHRMRVTRNQLKAGTEM